MPGTSDNCLNQHKEFYSGERHDQNQGRIQTPGSQHLLQLLKGGYLGQDMTDGHGKTALDVGCGSGFNCITMARMGFAVSGCEIDESIVEHARENLDIYGCEGSIEVGVNEALPYPDNSFDLLTSMNVIHYVAKRESMELTVREYARVLKPGGCLYITTNHPDNWLLEGATDLGNGTYKTAANGDYRGELELFVFQNSAELEQEFSPFLESIQTGENRFDFFSKIVRNLTLTGRKKG